MSYALLQQVAYWTLVGGESTTHVFSFAGGVPAGADPTAGSTLLLLLRWAKTPATAPAPVLQTLVDNAGNTWVAATSTAHIGQSFPPYETIQIWYCQHCLMTSGFALTATFDDATTRIDCTLVEFTGVGALLGSVAGEGTLTVAPYTLDLGTLDGAVDDLLVWLVTGPTGASSFDAWPSVYNWSGYLYRGVYGYVGPPTLTQMRSYGEAPDASTDMAWSLKWTGDDIAAVAIRFGPEPWVDIPNFHAHEWLNASEYPGGAARFLCDLWTTAAGVTMKARLVSLLADDTTIDAVVGTSAEVTATVPTDASFDVVLAGLKQHKLQVTSNPTDTDLWCAPGAKVLP